MYRGAGLLFAHRPDGQGWEVLLGERASGSECEARLARWGWACGAGYWSVPGGGFEPEDTSLRESAVRECLQECWNDRFALRRPVEPQFQEELARVLGGEFDAEILDTPHVQGWLVMEYHTFLVRLGHRPDPDVWPRANYEYTAEGFRWWPVAALPEKLHFCARKTIDHFRRTELRDVGG